MQLRLPIVEPTTRSAADGDVGKRSDEITPAEPAASLRQLAARLPSNIRLGCSSWSFPGWTGLVYDPLPNGKATTAQRLSRHGLGAYAAHPLFGAVGLDRTFYAPMARDAFETLGRSVPPTFRFLVKAHEACTTAHFPLHPRYGSHSGQASPHFLDAAYASEVVVAPAMEGLGSKLGVMLWQFPPQRLDGGKAATGRFVDRLARFLSSLPQGPVYAVELRNRELLTGDYAEALRDLGICHAVNVHPTMDAPRLQAARVGLAQAPMLVVRWMLPTSLSYEEAKRRFAPFHDLAAPDPESGRAIVELLAEAVNRGQPALVIVNNKAEGSAPRSVERLAVSLAARLRGTP